MKISYLFACLLLVSCLAFAANATDVASGIQSNVQETKQMFTTVLPIMAFISILIGLAITAGGYWILKNKPNINKLLAYILVIIGLSFILGGIIGFVLAFIAPWMIDSFMTPFGTP